jgi:hypothetical protein
LLLVLELVVLVRRVLPRGGQFGLLGHEECKLYAGRWIMFGLLHVRLLPMSMRRPMLFVVVVVVTRFTTLLEFVHRVVGVVVPAMVLWTCSNWVRQNKKMWAWRS